MCPAAATAQQRAIRKTAPQQTLEKRVASLERQVQALLQVIHIQGGNVTIEADNDLTLRADRNLSAIAKKDATVDADGKLKLLGDQEVQVKSLSKVDHVAPSVD